MLLDTRKARTAEELQQSIFIPIIPFKEPSDSPNETLFPWKTHLSGWSSAYCACGIHIFNDDFEVVQQWNSWYSHPAFFGCFGALLADLTRKTQGLRHFKTEILKLEFGPFRKARATSLVGYKIPFICRLYVKTTFRFQSSDPSTVKPVQTEKIMKYVFAPGNVDGSTEEPLKHLQGLVIPELQAHVEQ